LENHGGRTVFRLKHAHLIRPVRQPGRQACTAAVEGADESRGDGLPVFGAHRTEEVRDLGEHHPER
jgi:hypothetical protein